MNNIFCHLYFPVLLFLTEQARVPNMYGLISWVRSM